MYGTAEGWVGADFWAKLGQPQLSMGPAYHHGRGISALLVLEQNYFAVGLNNGLIILHDRREQPSKKELHGHQAAVNTLTMLNGFLVSGANDGSVKLWNVASGDCEGTFSMRACSILGIFPDGHLGFNDASRKIQFCKIDTMPSYVHIINLMQSFIAFPSVLQHLSLENVKLGDVGFKQVLEIVQTNPNLQSLNLVGTDLTGDQMFIINETCAGKGLFPDSEGNYLSVRTPATATVSSTSSAMPVDTTTVVEDYLALALDGLNNNDNSKFMSAVRHLDVNAAIDNDGNTLLHHAAALGKLDCVAILTDLGANAQQRNHVGWTPGAIAFELMQKYSAIVQHLAPPKSKPGSCRAIAISNSTYGNVIGYCRFSAAATQHDARRGAASTTCVWTTTYV